MSNFEGRPVLVTGATRGIGRAIVEHLLSTNAHVIAAGRDAAKLSELATETGCETVEFDLASEEQVANAFKDMDVWGVVNCGGIGGGLASPENTDIDMFDQIMSINARGTLIVTKYAARRMIALGRGGSIVNVSSQASLRALKNHTSYGASKAAVDNITRVSALELGRYGIRVNSVHPTVVFTDMAAEYWGKPENGNPVLDRMPLGRWATADEVARPVAFLLSDDAAMITAVHLPIDGGYSNC